MSSFIRKSTSRQPSVPKGTRLSPASSLTTTTSTGVPSLDDILGGGLPLSCLFTILAPDPHSAYGELVVKYFIAQGISCGQIVCVVDDDADRLPLECMWISDKTQSVDDRHEQDEEIKIAWRYERMKQFQTTVSQISHSGEDYCRTFDLARRIPQFIVEDSIQKRQLISLNVSSSGFDDGGESKTIKIIKHLAEVIATESSENCPMRICIPSLGSPQWGDLNGEQLLHFLRSLRCLLRQNAHACAMVCLPPQFSASMCGGPGWEKKVGWLSDAAITLAAFSADPHLSGALPDHHGLLHIHSLPALHTLVPPSDRFSALRGLSSSDVSLTAGGSENNLAFKCTRRRLVFETLHLGLEGGVGERRTTVPENVIEMESSLSHISPTGTGSFTAAKGDGAAAARVAVALEVEPVDKASEREENAAVKGKKKAKKTVAFQIDRPKLYDF